MDDILVLKKLQRRQRDAEELLWQDSRLRAGLTDEQANRLLTWGTAVLRRSLVQTATMTDETADAFADELLARLRRVLRRTARLVEMGQTGEETAVLHAELQSLAEAWQTLTGEELEAGEQLISQIQRFPAQTLNILMTCFSSGQEEE
ncbi:MAG: hypothetical protein ACE5E7_19250 [Anaerolineae bacterium]